MFESALLESTRRQVSVLHRIHFLLAYRGGIDGGRGADPRSADLYSGITTAVANDRRGPTPSAARPASCANRRPVDARNSSSHGEPVYRAHYHSSAYYPSLSPQSRRNLSPGRRDRSWRLFPTDSGEVTASRAGRPGSGILRPHRRKNMRRPNRRSSASAAALLPPRRCFNLKPSYPPLAVIAHIQGTVVLEAITRRYQPTLLDSEPVEVLTEIDVNFQLEE